MASVLGYAAAGALQGLGAGLTASGVAARETAIRELEAERRGALAGQQAEQRQSESATAYERQRVLARESGERSAETARNAQTARDRRARERPRLDGTGGINPLGSAVTRPRRIATAGSRCTRRP